MLFTASKSNEKGTGNSGWFISYDCWWCIYVLSLIVTTSSSLPLFLCRPLFK